MWGRGSRGCECMSDIGEVWWVGGWVNGWVGGWMGEWVGRWVGGWVYTVVSKTRTCVHVRIGLYWFDRDWVGARYHTTCMWLGRRLAVVGKPTADTTSTAASEVAGLGGSGGW